MPSKRLKKHIYQYTAVFEQDEKDDGYTVTIPSLPGCISEGDTFEEAAVNIREAAELYLEVLRETSKKQIKPKTDRVVVASVDVAF